MTTVYLIKGKDRQFWYCQYVDPHTGKRKTVSTKTARRRDAERFAMSLEDRLRSHGAPADGSMLWLDFVGKYMREAMSRRKASTESRAGTVLDSYGKIMQPHWLRSVTPGQIAQYERALAGSASYRPATIATHLRTLKAAMNWAASQGLIAKCPDFPETERGGSDFASRGRPLSPTEFALLMRSVALCVTAPYRSSWRHLLRGLWHSGLRLGEALKLRWEPGPWPWIDQSGTRLMLRIVSEHEKGKRDRILPVVPDWESHLRRTPLSSRVGFVWSPIGEHGERCAFHHVSHTISAIGRASGIIVDPSNGRTATAHDLRRSFGTRWAERLYPAQLQALMRHRSIATTMKYYVQLDARKLSDDIWQLFG